MTICRLQRYFLWCLLTAETVPHFAHLILMMPSTFVPMSKSRCLQIGHFTCTTTSDSIGISTCITPFYLFELAVSHIVRGHVALLSKPIYKKDTPPRKTECLFALAYLYSIMVFFIWQEKFRTYFLFLGCHSLWQKNEWIQRITQVLYILFLCQPL